MKYIGIDFSGAQDAGKRIWIAEGVARDGHVVVEALVPARDLMSSGRDRATALRALADHIAGLGRSIVGIDAPNSLPRSFAPEGWAPWFVSFVAQGSAEAFRDACRRATGGRETKRRCDERAKTPFAAWNLRLYRQTWHSLVDLYAPLLQREAVTVAPFQRADSRPRLAEICPASTLKHLGLYKPYKGRKVADERQALLRAMTQRGRLQVPRGLRERAVEDAGGDALDAVIALAAAVRCRKRIERHEPDSEGEVYVWD